MYDVITVGSANVDVFARTRFSELIKIIDPKGETDLLAFPSGSKILIDELEISTGGGGTNTAVALSRLGQKVAFLGKLAHDINSEFILKDLKKEKIDMLCAYGDGSSGYSLILDTLEHDRTILTYRGVNDELKHSEIPYKKLKTKWLYLSSMVNESFHTLERLAEFAEQHEIKIAFNPSTYLAEKGCNHLKHVISRTELLVLNKEEACLLVGKETNEGLLLKLRDLGPRIIAVTDGKNELCVLYENRIYYAKPPQVKVVDATGAGDAFAASFLSGLLRRKDIEFAIKLGVVNSQSVIAHYGAKNILLTFNEATKAIGKLRMKLYIKRVKKA